MPTITDTRRVLLAMVCAWMAQSVVAESKLPPGVVATVNGEPLRRGLLDELAKARRASPNPDENQNRARLLDDLVATELLSQRAQASGLAARPPIKAELALAHKTLLGQRLLQQLAAEMEIGDDTLRARYNQIQPEHLLTVNHILLADEESARAVIAQLERGASFSALASRNSIDTETRERGGQLGTVNSSELVAPFVQAARSLKPGSFTRQPVRTEFGWHVIQLRAIRSLDKPAFEEVRAPLRSQIVSERLQAQVAQWRKEARITVMQTP